MIKKVNNIKEMLETLCEDMEADNVNVEDILEINQQLDEIIKEVTN